MKTPAEWAASTSPGRGVVAIAATNIALFAAQCVEPERRRCVKIVEAIREGREV